MSIRTRLLDEGESADSSVITVEMIEFEVRTARVRLVVRRDEAPDETWRLGPLPLMVEHAVPVRSWSTLIEAQRAVAELVHLLHQRAEQMHENDAALRAWGDEKRETGA